MVQGAPCPVGKYGIISEQGISMCKGCGLGTYQDVEGQAKCKLCSRGRYNADSINATSADACEACDVGTYAPSDGSATCIDCPPGTYCPSKGTSQYTECQAGYYAPLAGSTQCNPCAAGSFQPTPGSAFCHECPVGRYNTSSRLATGENQTCALCQAGRYANKNGTGECLQSLAILAIQAINGNVHPGNTNLVWAK